MIMKNMMTLLFVSVYSLSILVSGAMEPQQASEQYIQRRVYYIEKEVPFTKIIHTNQTKEYYVTRVLFLQEIGKQLLGGNYPAEINQIIMSFHFFIFIFPCAKDLLAPYYAGTDKPRTWSIDNKDGLRFYSESLIYGNPEFRGVMIDSSFDGIKRNTIVGWYKDIQHQYDCGTTRGDGDCFIQLVYPTINLKQTKFFMAHRSATLNGADWQEAERVFCKQGGILYKAERPEDIRILCVR